MLAAQMLGKTMFAFVLDPRRDEVDLDHCEHTGQELVYVLGRINLHYLGTGDLNVSRYSAYFEFSVAHHIRARGRAKRRVLIVIHDQPDTPPRRGPITR
jgi:hypothetical protein